MSETLVGLVMPEPYRKVGWVRFLNTPTMCKVPKVARCPLTSPTGAHLLTQTKGRPATQLRVMLGCVASEICNAVWFHPLISGYVWILPLQVGSVGLVVVSLTGYKT